MLNRFAGSLTLEEVWRLDRAFWSVWSGHNRIIMDYRAVDTIDINVQEFTKAGLAAQADLAPAAFEIKAAYVAADDGVYAFLRVIEEVWSSYVTITVCRSLPDALAWLDVAPDVLEAAQLRETG